MRRPARRESVIHAKAPTRADRAAAGPLALTVIAVGAGLATATASLDGQERPASAERFEVMEASIAELQEALETGRVTSVELVEAYLDRIAAYDQTGPEINAVIRPHPRAREQAVALDRERAAGRVRGPLHGIPILLKDNYDTYDMPTSGSTLAMAGLVPPDDAFQVRALREAGAIILAKTNLHELAAGITSTSSLGGQTRNPYAPERNPGGSSGGTGAGVAASFAAVGWGSDTCGSIRIPSAVHNLVGLRPTKGLSSIDGIVPLSHTQDTGGPLARSVADLAVALDATVGRDPADPATAVLADRPMPIFTEALDPDALAGARIGALEVWLDEDGQEAEVTRVVRRALEAMTAAGAEVVDVTIPALDSLMDGTSVIGLEFAVDLAAYLEATPGAPIERLGEIVDLGLHHEVLDGTFRRRRASEPRDEGAYEETLKRQRALRDAVTSFMDEYRLDALAYPTLRREPALIGAAPIGSTCQLAAHSGLPAISAPAGFTRNRLPVGLELLGRPFDDARLVSLAFALEAATTPRRPPARTPPLEAGRPPEPTRFSVRADAGWAGRDSGVRTEASFLLDRPRGTLDYVVVTSGLPAEEVHAVVLQRRGGAAPDAVVARLSGPGRTSVDGTLELSALMLADLDRGLLELALYTRDRPLGAARVRLDP
ncbi:MAG: amidase [Gemmatimonadetes bacterium]|nr:amidase [Gemmatimonadota bacterium]